MSTTAGLHVPGTPFTDVAGNTGTAAFAQIVNDVPKLNVGVVFGVTVTVNVVAVAQTPIAGVNVYTPDACVLTVAGLHVPATPLSEVPGNVGTLPPAQIASVVPKLNAGVIFATTVTLNVAGNAHNPAVGVNV